MIDAEKQCCRYLRLRLTVEAGGPVELDVTGSAGSQEFFPAILEPVSCLSVVGFRRRPFLVGAGAPCALGRAPLDSANRT
jgi:hypothetical protein